MEKTILSPEEFYPCFSAPEEPETRAARTVGRSAAGEWLLRRVTPEAAAFEKTESYWLLEKAECKALLIDALKRGCLTMPEYTALQKELRATEAETPAAKKPAQPKPAPKKPGEVCICRSEGAEIGLLKDTRPYLRYGGEEYTLSCHPGDPCTYIRKNSKIIITIRNAFEIYGAYDTLAEGGTVTSVSGREYDAPAFCALLAAALNANRDELSVEELEAMLPREEPAPCEEAPDAEGPDGGAPEEDGLFDIFK